VLHVIKYDKFPYSFPDFPQLKLDTLVKIYGAAQRLRLNHVMNIVLDKAHEEAINYNSLSWTTMPLIYKNTSKGTGLRSWFIDQACLLDSEIYPMFQDIWPVEALIDLAMALRSRSIPPMAITDLPKYHQSREESRLSKHPVFSKAESAETFCEGGTTVIAVHSSLYILLL
jgi:hypothetical protein